MTNRLALWGYFLVITTVLVIRYEMELTDNDGDPSSGAIWGFLPFLIPLFIFEAAKFLVIPYTLSEAFIWMTKPKKDKQ